MRILAGTVLLALAVGSPATAQRSVDQRRPAARDAAVSIYMLRGSVRVVGWAVDSVVVTGAVAEGPGQLFLGGSRRGLKLGVWGQGKELEPQAADLEVRVPAGSRVWVKAADAGIEVTGVHGGLDLYSVGGPIRVAGSPRDVRAESMAGDVEIAASTPSLRAKSASGTVLLRGSAE
ncbi:MAG: hypothetical protein HY703_07625, partial [Gemmatimonadetes bacterium]|nr:hypothetical protein [Gemmatimonadota bacterium]